MEEQSPTRAPLGETNEANEEAAHQPIENQDAKESPESEPDYKKGFHYELMLLLLFLFTVVGIVFTWQTIHAPVTTPNEQVPGSEVPPAQPTASSFEECAQYYEVMESYPEQCSTPDGATYVRDIGNELEKIDLIRVASPRPGETIESPLTIEGEARGYWFFEASAPVVLTNWDGLIIAEGYVTADGGWMTEDFVPFSGELTFEADTSVSERGTLILQKANASGLPEHDDALEFPITLTPSSTETPSNVE